jgi:hypothetical protein
MRDWISKGSEQAGLGEGRRPEPVTRRYAKFLIKGFERKLDWNSIQQNQHIGCEQPASGLARNLPKLLTRVLPSRKIKNTPYKTCRKT